MEVLHQGFDGLDLALQGQIPHELALELDSAKLFAASSRQDALLEVNGVRLLVADTGARGGYAWRCDTGPFGAIWFFKRPNASDPWGIRVSVKSLPLAVHGLGRVRHMLDDTLAGLGVRLGADGVSIGRVDYTLDLLAPSFVLDRNAFVMHARCARKTHDDMTDMTESGHSGRTTSVTIGRNPGRQIIVYDKRAEVIAHRKVEWPEIWNANRTAANLPPLDLSSPAASRVWRIELRAYKRHLKDVWQVTSWADLDAKLGDIYAAMLADIRYTAPSSDTNRARWPDHAIWQIARTRIMDDLFEMQCNASPNRIKEVLRAEQLRVLQAQHLGLAVSMAAIEEADADRFGTYLSDTALRARVLSEAHPVGIDERIAKAKARYVFVG